MLTIDATDPLSGTAEFKACAVSVVPMRSAPAFELADQQIDHTLVAGD